MAWCLLFIQTNQASVGHFSCTKQWRIRALLRNLKSWTLTTTTTKKKSVFYDSEPPYAARVIKPNFHICWFWLHFDLSAGEGCWVVFDGVTSLVISRATWGKCWAKTGPRKQEAIKLEKTKQHDNDNDNDKERITLLLHDMTEQNWGILLF